MQVTIREYESTDFSIVKKLILEADNFGEPFLETELLNIRKNTSLGLGKIFVAALKNQVIGYISLGKRIFALMIDSIIVDRNYQRRGVGRKLIGKAKDFAESQGFRVLRTDTATFMDYAIKFYLACGFVPCGYVEHDFGLGSKQLHFYMELNKEERPNSILEFVCTLHSYLEVFTSCYVTICDHNAASAGMLFSICKNSCYTSSCKC